MAPLVPAVPLVSSLAACGEWGLTVAPYIHQLQELPYRFLDSISSVASLKELYVSTNPVVSGFAFSLAIAPIFLVVSEVNRNYSQVDRCWSILPTIYNIHYAVWAHLAGVPTARLDGVVIFSVFWSVRIMLL